MKHILVVDDEPPMLNLLSRVLSATGYRVTTSQSGPAAIASVGSQPIDLVVTDYRMPDMNGWELIRALREQRPGLPALIVTGCPPTGADEQQWWDEQPHLAKPFTPRSLRDAVVRLIGEALDVKDGIIP